jgi:3-hydroxyisobutyrate dehydrogenase-like beta-hydroxyacid dehydrogenase
VEQVLLGPDGAVHGAQPGAVFIDMSTISLETARNLADRLYLHQIEFLDAPVSGGDVGARNATLTIIWHGGTAWPYPPPPWFKGFWRTTWRTVRRRRYPKPCTER